jgi:Uma2 family endonuclease
MSKSPLHSFLIQFLHETLSPSLPPACHLRTEQPMTCGDSEPEPDLAVVSGRNEDFKRDHPHTADLVIEVSITNREYYLSKLRAYATADVKECWFILVPEGRIEVYRQAMNGQFTDRTVYGPGGSVTSTALPGFSLWLDALFAK